MLGYRETSVMELAGTKANQRERTEQPEMSAEWFYALRRTPFIPDVYTRIET